VEPAAWCVFDEEVVAGHVEDLGEADDGVGRRCGFAVLIAADLGGIGADLGGELALGPLVLGSWLSGAVPDGRGVGLVVLFSRRGGGAAGGGDRPVGSGHDHHLDPGVAGGVGVFAAGDHHELHL
jgi:hypothetical protein